jgi:formylglycine-generating enzyme required for sulfatase activity
MRLIEGNYCRKVEQLCLHGSRLVDTGKTYTVDGVTRPIMTGKEYRCKNGCVPEPMDVCYEFVQNHAPCISTKKVKGADGLSAVIVDEEPMSFCMDTYEWPNRVGELPRVMVTWFEARKLCQGQGKRLCDDTEWTLACEGPERLPYPYGWSRDDTLCNIDRTFIAFNAKRLFSGDPAVAAAELARLSQREPIGQRLTCVSPYGVYDLTGNVDEWTNHVTGNGYPHKSAFKGGHWVRGIRNRCRPKASSHGPEFAFYAEGFRCCADSK